MEPLSERVKPKIECIVNIENLPIESGPSGRIYIHKSGLYSAFGSQKFAIEYARMAFTEYIDPRAKGERKVIRDTYQFLIGILWGNPEHNKMIDFIGITGLTSNPEDWPGNQDSENWIVRNGILVPDNEKKRYSGISPLTCGDGRIILGEEEKWRRTCNTFEEYVKTVPLILGEFPVKKHSVGLR